MIDHVVVASGAHVSNTAFGATSMQGSHHTKVNTADSLTTIGADQAPTPEPFHVRATKVTGTGENVDVADRGPFTENCAADTRLPSRTVDPVVTYADFMG